jgi:hypothetical protein
MSRLSLLALVALLTASFPAAANDLHPDFSVARFLEQTSHLNAETGRTITSDGGLGEFRAVDTRVVTNGWILETGYGSTSADAQPALGSTRQWRMATGFYLVHNTEVKVAYDRLDDSNDTRTDRFAVGVTHVQRLKRGMSWSMNGFIAQLKRDSARGKLDGTDAEVTAGWFFRDNLGVGARLAIGDRQGSGDFKRYEAFADYQLSDRASFGVSLVNERIPEFNYSSDALVLAFTYRR